MASAKIGFLGAGRIAEALVRSLLRAEFCKVSDLVAHDPAAARCDVMQSLGVAVLAGNRELAAASQMIIVAVKPGLVPAVLQEIAPAVRNQLVASLAAGVTLATLEGALPVGSRVIRVMPNIACQVGEMAAGFCRGRAASDADVATLKALLDAVGRSYEVPEELMDAVTGLSGSGPAYIFTVIEALAAGGVQMGLPREVALGLAAQTVCGAARMVLELGKQPAELRDAVTSPGGTTIEGLHALERAGVRQAFISAVEAATVKSKALGRK